MGLLKRDTAPAARRLTAALLAAISLFSRAALAVPEEDRDKARKLADQGKAALARKDYAVAADLFTRASAIISAPTLELGRARAEVGLGHFRAARQIYASIADKPVDPSAPPAFGKAVSEAAAELAELDQRMPSVRISIQGPAAKEAEVLLDGAPLPKPEPNGVRLLDPGPHVARASAPDFGPAEASFTAKEGVVSQIQLDLEAKLFAAKHRRTMLSSALLGLGVGSLAVGGATGALFLKDRSDPRPAWLALPALGVGVIGVGVGTGLFISSNREGGLLPVKLGPGLFGAGIAGLGFGAASGFISLAEKSTPALGTVAIISLATGSAATLTGTLLILLAKEAPKPPTEAERLPRSKTASRGTEITVAPYLGPGIGGVYGRF
jgi:hypothetical protein